jgi:hypothetical protein
MLGPRDNAGGRPFERIGIFREMDMPRRGRAKLRLSRGFRAASTKTREHQMHSHVSARNKHCCFQRQAARPGCIRKTRDLIQSVCRLLPRPPQVASEAFPFGSCVLAKPIGKPRLRRSFALPCRRHRQLRRSFESGQALRHLRDGDEILIDLAASSKSCKLRAH